MKAAFQGSGVASLVSTPQSSRGSVDGVHVVLPQPQNIMEEWAKIPASKQQEMFDLLLLPNKG